ncbi:hypothetical protein ZIOFF_005984 [Zingiber officinale]|uniref:F-box/LRR-repeat protein 15-like leucin rich repeat domain-containing protein n=3 Tax=Zingiber officinale TaxID=94328 RepID=A0A8J5I228_ZINOF|nr:hypothetical protein ZIOFF_005984 [Zingiber officinale]
MEDSVTPVMIDAGLTATAEDRSRAQVVDGFGIARRREKMERHGWPRAFCPDTVAVAHHSRCLLRTWHGFGDDWLLDSSSPRSDSANRHVSCWPSEAPRLQSPRRVFYIKTTPAGTPRPSMEIATPLPVTALGRSSQPSLTSSIKALPDQILHQPVLETSRLVAVSAFGKKMETDAAVTMDWKDLPAELLRRILSLVDSNGAMQIEVVASCVCTGWRDAIGLTNLSLSWCNKDMNILVQSLVPKFPQLQVLTLRQNYVPQLEDNAVEIVAKYCHELQELDLSKSLRLTDRSLYALGNGCPYLTKLNISGCSAFGHSALAYLASCCVKLKKMNLCGCVRAATDTALQSISHHCSQLQSLNLGWCESVTDKGVTSLASGCPDLRDLDLCGCVLITDESVIALANCCLHLRSLDLYYCQNITDKAMYSLANNSSKSRLGYWQRSSSSSNEEGLMNLNISQCTALTASAVQAVCDSFPSLHTCLERNSLIISGCLGLTSVHCACAVRANHAEATVLADHHAPY